MEAELGMLINAQEGSEMCLILDDFGYLQTLMPIHCDNSTAVGVANNNVKKQ